MSLFLALSLTPSLSRRAERQQAEHALRGPSAARRLPLVRVGLGFGFGLGLGLGSAVHGW